MLTDPLPPFPTPPAASPSAGRHDAPLARAGLTLLPAGDADLPFLRVVYAATRDRELAPLPWPDAIKAAFLQSQFALQHRHLMAHHPAGDYWLVTQHGAAIGRLYLDRSGPVWRLTDIALLPEARGQGAGTRLLRWLQHAAAAAGADLDLHVAHDNAGAARLYARLGFVPAEGEHATHRRLLWRRTGPMPIS